ncbi:hypothetical protein [Oricola indica]|uniref:hypothetical protein n=1 Tax=Oricola indica TaxID=2872591 RepID=UPI001CC12465|nr:hypothetical protein [Oricola indica]
MLQRLFSRGAPRERIEHATAHGAETEQQEVLRERSTAILERLERKQEEAEKAELARRLAEREAAEREEHEAAEHEAAERENYEVAGQAAQDNQSEDDVDRDDAVAETDEQAPVFGEDDDAPAMMADAIDDAPDVAFDDRPQDFEADPEPAELDAADGAFAGQEEPVAETAAPPENDAVPAENHRETDDLFSDSEPLRPVILPHTISNLPGEDGAVHSHAGHAASSDDPEVHEQLRRKAEEARERIAKRLKAMKDEEEAKAASGRLDFGEDTPPIAPGLDEDN